MALCYQGEHHSRRVDSLRQIVQVVDHQLTQMAWYSQDRLFTLHELPASK